MWGRSAFRDGACCRWFDRATPACGGQYALNVTGLPRSLPAPFGDGLKGTSSGRLRLWVAAPRNLRHDSAVTDGADRSWTYELKRDDLGTSRGRDVAGCARRRRGAAQGQPGGPHGQQRHLRRPGEAFDYWEFFPAADGWESWLWGFADVVESTVAGVDVGSRFYGYHPAAGHLLCGPGVSTRADSCDASKHRENLDVAVANARRAQRHRPAAGDDAATEELQILFRRCTDVVHVRRLDHRQSLPGRSRSFVGIGVGLTAPHSSWTARTCGSSTNLPGNKDHRRSRLGDEVFTYDELTTCPPTPRRCSPTSPANSPAGTFARPPRRRVGEGRHRRHDQPAVRIRRHHRRRGHRNRRPPGHFSSHPSRCKRFLDWGRDGITDRFAES